MARRRFDRLFKLMHSLALQGLNYGLDVRPHKNGEVRVLRELAKNWPRGPIVFDVGANRGDWTRQVLACAPTATVHVFEPQQDLQVHLHSLGDRVIVNCKALGRESAETLLYGEGELASLFKRRALGLQAESVTRTVATLSLAEYCSARGVAHIDLLKIDAEGSEFDVLQGAGEMLYPERISAVQFEFGGTQIDSRKFMRDFRDLLESRGYRIMRVVRDGVVPVVPDEVGEIFVYSNFLAMRGKLPTSQPAAQEC